MDARPPCAFNYYMARCNECNSVITIQDDDCYVCGEPVPGAKKRATRRRREQKPAPPITPLSNLLFIASLVLTLVSFLSNHKMSMSLSATLSGILFVARLVSDRVAAKTGYAQ
jgi:hypothetical protein